MNFNESLEFEANIKGNIEDVIITTNLVVLRWIYCDGKKPEDITTEEVQAVFFKGLIEVLGKYTTKHWKKLCRNIDIIVDDKSLILYVLGHSFEKMSFMSKDAVYVMRNVFSQFENIDYEELHDKCIKKKNTYLKIRKNYNNDNETIWNYCVLK